MTEFGKVEELEALKEAADRDAHFAEVSLLKAEADNAELRRILKNMSEVLRAVVTSEDFAPPRDVCHNTQWEAAGYWIARAKSQLGELPKRTGDFFAGDYRCPHHPKLAECECYCQFVGCSAAACPDDGLLDGIDILAEVRWFIFYLGAVVTHAATTPLDDPSGESLREASRGLLRLVPFLWTVIRRLLPEDETKIKAELVQEAYEPVATMRARAKEKSA